MFEVYKSFEVIDSNKPLVYGLFEEDNSVDISKEINLEIETLINDKNIKAKLGYINKVYTFKKCKNDIIYLIGLGKKEEFNYEKLEVSLRDVNYKLGSDLIINLDSFIGNLNIKEVAKRMVLTISFYNYAYDECLTEKANNDLVIKFVTRENVINEINESFSVATAISNVRDLVNKPYNYLTASDLAEYAINLVNSLDDRHLSIKVYNKKEIQDLEMNAFLGVNKGSTAEPKLIHIKYEGSNNEPIGLVGKGLMYDTGGYTIKQVMNNMKDDMAGAATVLGILEAIVKNELKINLQVVICATDNRIDGGALLPDDVLTAMNKKTIEIISTDAEGRLTLADAVTFAQKEGCKEIIDLATLTGAIVVALGEYTTGLFGNDQENIKKMIESSKEANEELWHMPINDYIREQVRSSKVADLKNSTGRGMGASGAAAFIEEFIEKDTKWMHLDIAGTAFHTTPAYKEFYGATGATLKTIYNYLKANKSK